jgi:small subunit ribosomal protein S16
VCPRARRQDLAPNEIIGSFDPMPNERGEKLASLDIDRFSYWLGQGAHLTQEVKNIFGLVGVLPISPEVILTASKNRIKTTEKTEEQKKEEGTLPEIVQQYAHIQKTK